MKHSTVISDALHRVGFGNLFIVPILLLTSAFSACDRTDGTPDPVAAGNFCSDIGRLVWASNRGRPALAPAEPRESFNIFIMDEDGQNTEQLTTDGWPTVNQHPVFTQDCTRIVWIRGNIDKVDARSFSSVWVMDVDGSNQERLGLADVKDGHTWVGADNRIYFVRHENGLHRIRRMSFDNDSSEIVIGDDDWDRFHPNLHLDRNLVLYTAAVPGDTEGVEIRVYNQATDEDTTAYKPGGDGRVSAAIWHPNGSEYVTAVKPAGSTNGNYVIVRISYPDNQIIGQPLTSDLFDNTIPYYAYPDAHAIDWNHRRMGLQARNVAIGSPDGSGQRLLTNDAWEDTKIVGEISLSADGVCTARPVGCYATPPPCGAFLLPEDTADDAEEFAREKARIDLSAGNAADVAPDAYRQFALASLLAFVDGNVPVPDDELAARAAALSEYMSDLNDEGGGGRAAEVFVNTYLAEVAGNAIPRE